jgi:hypothetical protein
MAVAADEHDLVDRLIVLPRLLRSPPLAAILACRPGPGAAGAGCQQRQHPIAASGASSDENDRAHRGQISKEQTSGTSPLR